MDFRHLLDRSPLCKSLSERIQALQKNAGRSLSQTAINRIKGGVFVFLAVFIGLKADEISYLNAKKRWLTRNPPSDIIWKYAMTSQGFHQMNNSYMENRAVRKLPLVGDDLGAVWLSDNMEWLAVFQDPKGLDPPTVFTNVRKSDYRRALPKSWGPMGLGWIGFEEAMRRIEANKPKARPKTRSKKWPKPWNDPREISY